MSNQRPTADQLNEHLANGGVVRVATTYRVTDYTKKHAGWFSEKGKDLHVNSGNKTLCLSLGNSMLVSVQLGRLVQKG